jgi:acyl-CoA thioesterase-2
MASEKSRPARRSGPRIPLSSLLDLEEVGGDRYVAPAAPGCEGRMFGGQFLAQALVAAQRSIAGDRAVHSLHGYFLRAGDASQPTELRVERVRDGRSFSQRAVQALQQDRECFRTLLSFHVPEAGLEYEVQRMPEVPTPDEVALTYAEFIEAQRIADDSWEGGALPMDIRYINPPAPGERVVEHQLMWMRISEPLEDDHSRHDAGLAYLSDSTLIDHVLLPHGRRWHDADVDGASLDHALWFHRPARADEWLLFDQSAEWTGAARGLAAGRLFDRTGRLVATCVQEGLIRTDR